jgi:hypothetical protein
MRAQIERHTKLAFDVVDALDEAIGDFPVQKFDATAVCRAVAVPPPGAPIEQHQWEVVGLGHRGETCGSGLTKALAT